MRYYQKVGIEERSRYINVCCFETVISEWTGLVEGGWSVGNVNLSIDVWVARE